MTFGALALATVWGVKHATLESNADLLGSFSNDSCLAEASKLSKQWKGEASLARIGSIGAAIVGVTIVFALFLVGSFNCILTLSQNRKESDPQERQNFITV